MSSLEWVEFGVVKMEVPGCIGAVDLTQLLPRRGGVRGMDVEIETQDGERPAPRRRASWMVLLEFRVFGKNNFAGTPYADPRVGVRDNIGYLENAIVAPYAVGNTIKLTHHFSDGNEWEADVVVEDIIASAIVPGIGTAANIAVSVKIPSGRLTAVTP